jgi:hypothetical protein
MWTREKDERLRVLWNDGKTTAAIAQELGYSAAYMSVKAAALCLPARQHRVYPNNEQYLIDEAKKRGVTTSRLIARVCKVIVNDRLIGAVLDDEGSLERQIASGGDGCDH